MSQSDKNLCEICGKETRKRHHKTCGDLQCRKEYRTVYIRRRVEDLVSSGLCRNCQKPNDTKNQRCRECTKRCVARQQRWADLRASKGICTACRKEAGRDRRMCDDCMEKSNEWHRINCRKNKAEALAAYGGPFCACCGETTMSMLTLDHIDQNGAQDRRDYGSGTPFYSVLKKKGYPSGLRVLCYNCNIAVYREPDHLCPHRTGCFADPPVSRYDDLMGANPN